MNDARAKYPNKPFRLLTQVGEVVILPAFFSQEIRNSPEFNFGKAIHAVCQLKTPVTNAASNPTQEFSGDIPGFEGLATGARGDEILQSVARKPLTKSLGGCCFNPASSGQVLTITQIAKVTTDLSEEASDALSLNLNRSTSIYTLISVTSFLFPLPNQIRRSMANGHPQVHRT